MIKSPKVSLVVSVNMSCVCIRTHCNKITVNSLYNVSIKAGHNVCLCNVYSVKGCDITWVQPQVKVVDIHTHYQLYNKIAPVQLGVNVSLLQQLVTHPILKTHLEALQKEGRKVDLAVHHSTEKIEQILERVKMTATHNWWSKFLYPGLSAIPVWQHIINPVTILLIIQLITICVIVKLYFMFRKLRGLTWTRATSVLFRRNGDGASPEYHSIKEGN